MNNPPTMPREDVLRVKLELLQREHRDLDAAHETRVGAQVAQTAKYLT